MIGTANFRRENDFQWLSNAIYLFNRSSEWTRSAIDRVRDFDLLHTQESLVRRYSLSLHGRKIKYTDFPLYKTIDHNKCARCNTAVLIAGGLPSRGTPPTNGLKARNHAATGDKIIETLISMVGPPMESMNILTYDN